MSDILDEILGSGGGDLIKTLAAARAYKDAKEKGVTVLQIRLSLGVDETRFTCDGFKDAIEYLGIESECKQFSNEIKKYGKKFAEAVSDKFQERIVKKPEETARRMAKWMIHGPSGR